VIQEGVVASGRGIRADLDLAEAASDFHFWSRSPHVDGAHRSLENLALALPHRRLAMRSASAFAARFSWRWVIRATRRL
jgi:hypothetical protein